MFERLLVAVDQSEHAARTLAAAQELAEKAGSEVRVLRVEEMGFAGRAGQIALEDPNEVKQAVADAVASLEAAGVEASGTVRAAQSTRVAAEIAAEATEWGAGVIVAGSHGRSGIEGVLIGSTVNKLLHLVDTPVLVVH